MKIIILGTGYVGLVSAACFTELGHHVVCIDVNPEKIAALRDGVIPIYEPGLEALVKKNALAGRLIFEQNLQQVEMVPDCYVLAVGTPSAADGSANLSYVDAAAADIAAHLKDYAVVVDKSTVPVGTTERVTNIIAGKLKEAARAVDFEVVSNPEFLKEGAAVKDCLEPDRVITGAVGARAFEVMKALYAPLNLSSDQYLEMSPREAEMTKYVANAMLATKISFMNEMANICEQFEVDVEKVKLGISKDSRIGSSFINPGCGYGGSCFPKDVKALIHLAKTADFEPSILNAVEQRNADQKKVLAQKLSRAFSGELSGKTVALLGLAFKPGTDDLREASAVEFIEEALAKGVRIKAYDPVAMQAAKKQFPSEWFSPAKLTLCDNLEACLEQADALVLATEWPEFKALSLETLAQQFKDKVIIDGRNIFNPQKARELGFHYVGIGR